MGIRLLSEKDLIDYKMLEQICFPRPWTLQQCREELTNEQTRILGYYAQDQLIGAIVARLFVDEWWILRLMTHPHFRKKGIGSKLLESVEMHTLSALSQAQLWLEVGVRNSSAINLYLKNGYVLVSTRMNYYPADPVSGRPEDAIILRKWRRVQDENYV